MRRRLLNRNQNRGVSGRSGTDFIPTAYADSISGSDANSGLIQSAPKATLAATVALTAAARSTATARGSTWREALDVSALAGASVYSYGTGTLPIVSGASIVAAGSWTAEGTANVYKATVTHDLTGTNRGCVYEDGVLLTRVADVATCSTTPGSFVDIKGSDGSPWTVKIRASSGNPTSNGKVYEVSNRTLAFNGAASQSVDGLIVQRCGSNDGPLRASAQSNGTYRRILALDGTKHNGVVGDGALVEDSIFARTDPPTSYETSSIFLTAFANSANGKAFAYNRVFAIGPVGSGIIQSFYCHGNSGNFAGCTLTQCGAYKVTYDNSPQSYADTLIGYFSDQCLKFPTAGNSGGASMVNQGMMVRIPNTLANNDLNLLTCSDSCILLPASASDFIMRPSGPHTMTNVSMAGYAANPNMYNMLSPAGTSAVSWNYCVFPGSVIDLIITNHPYTGDYNVFSTPFSLYDGTETQRTSLAAWQSATGQDAHSCVRNAADQTAGGQYAFYLGWVTGGSLATSGPAVGDFRINPNARVYDAAGNAYIGTYPDGTTPITRAGTQRYWNWNTRAWVSGAPSKFPTLPTTYADWIAYVASPTSWNFYP